VINVTVVGGGPAGLAAAYRISRSDSVTVRVLERAPVLGGLAAGFSHGDCVLDFGPHRLHPEIDPVVLGDLRAMLGDDLMVRPRRGLIRLGDRFLPYPVGPRTILGLGAPAALRLAAGLARARLARDQRTATFEDAVVARLGRPLYERFYGPYAEKVWGRSGVEIAAEQADRRVNQRGLGDAVRLALGRGRHHYLYPRGGFGRIPAAYATALAATPQVEVAVGQSIERVLWGDGRVRALVAAGQAGSRTLALDHLVWSAPITELVRRLDPAPPMRIVEAAGSLRYRAVVLCYVTLARERVGNADTYYFPERAFPFNRVTEQKNFDDSMIPADRTVLAMDISCDPDDPVYARSDDATADAVLPALESVGLLRRSEVLEVFTRRFRSAYPIYDLAASSHLAAVQSWLDGIDNLWPIGRQGLYLHNNTHHSLLMGYRAADTLLADARAHWPQHRSAFAAMRVAD
jgi:protoporphyrinogen oxidase